MVLLCHPNVRSFNHAIADTVVGTLRDDGHHVWWHDLYAEHFAPVLEQEEIQRRFSFDDPFVEHAEQLRTCDGLVFIYPDWWGTPPALLKGWIDRMFRPGIAYQFEGPEFEEKHKVALLRGRRALVLTTTDETNPLSQTPMQTIWRERIFEYVGIREVTFKVLYGLRETRIRERRAWLIETAELARRWADTAV